MSNYIYFNFCQFISLRKKVKIYYYYIRDYIIIRNLSCFFPFTFPVQLWFLIAIDAQDRRGAGLLLLLL